MAMTYWTYKKYDYLVDDKVIERTANLLDRRRLDFVDWIKENEPLEECPICSSTQIRYEWNSRICYRCGYNEDIDVPLGSGGKTASRSFDLVFKEVFGSVMGVEKNKERKVNKGDLKNIPYDFERFNSAEYTEQQQEFLIQRFKEIVETENVHFTEADMSTIHFLVIQELKVKDLYRLEAYQDNVKSGKDFSKEFSMVKKRELGIYKDLQKEVKKIIDKQSKSQEENSMLSYLNNEVNNKGLRGILDEYLERVEERQEKLLESIQRRKETGNYREVYDYEQKSI